MRQWPELGVAIKNSKRATTFLLPIPVLLAVAQTWDQIVRPRLPAAAPWYAPISVHWGSQSLDETAPGMNRHQALDKRLRKLFDLAGLPYKSAHKFRHGHAVYGFQHAQTMADYKAVSMNLIHEDIKITDEIMPRSCPTKYRFALAGWQPRSQTQWITVLSPWFEAYRIMIYLLSCELLQKAWFCDAHALAQSFQTVYNAKQI